MNKLVILSIGISALLIGGVFVLGSQSSSGQSGAATVVDGKQFIDITAKGGYTPRTSTAIFFERSPLAMEVATSAMLRT